MPRRRRPLIAALAVAAVAAPAPAAGATPPGSNGAIVWQRETRTNPPTLWVANPDGTGRRAVFTAGGVEFDAAWSPADPALLAFTRAGDRAFAEEIFIGDITTGAARRLTDGRPAAVEPAFAPDGLRVAYVETEPPRRGRARPPRARIHVVNLDGSGRMRLTGRRTACAEPDWSPDGLGLVFTETRMLGATPQSRLVIMDVASGTRRAVTGYGGADEVNGRWTPDGRRIVFEALAQDRRDSDIETIGADGRGRRRLLATPAFETHPVPSPDGARIAFTSDRDRRGRGRLGAGFELYTMAADGTDVVRLTRNRKADLWPDWQRLPAAPPVAVAVPPGR